MMINDVFKGRFSQHSFGCIVHSDTCQNRKDHWQVYELRGLNLRFETPSALPELRRQIQSVSKQARIV
jgi:hypothetical protein